MLVLSRKCEEEVVLPQCGVVLRILAIRGDKVRVGICAPADVRVYRREVWERMQQNDAEEALVPTDNPGDLL